MATETIRTEGVRHETRDASIPALAIFGGVIVFTIAAVYLFSSILFGIYKRTLPMGPPPTPFQAERQLPPEPRLQPAPRLDLQTYINAQQFELNSYGWVNRRNGIVRIPIARAMQLLLKQGLSVENVSQTAHTRNRSALRNASSAANAFLARSATHKHKSQRTVSAHRAPTTPAAESRPAVHRRK